jgi:hypothetical protein
MRRILVLLASLIALAPACKSKDNTKIVVAVWSDLAIPSKLNRIRIDVTGPTKSSSNTFLLTAGSEPGKTQLPAQLELVPLGPKEAGFTVKATGLLDQTEIVSQTASVSFVPGQSLLLKLFLYSDCSAKSCTADYTCAAGACTQPIAVTNLPPYDPKNLLPPDAGIDSSIPVPDSSGPMEGGAHEAGGDDLRPNDGPPIDATIDQSPDVRVDIAGTGGSDGGSGSAGAGGTSASTETGGIGGSSGVGGTGGRATGGIDGGVGDASRDNTGGSAVILGGSSGGGGGSVASGGTNATGGAGDGTGGAGTGDAGTGDAGTGGSGGSSGGTGGTSSAGGSGGSNFDAAPDAPQPTPDAACVPETDQQMCARLGKNCNAISDFDNCGKSRSVTTCGTCTAPQVCGTFVANVCPPLCVLDQSFLDQCVLGQ